MRTSELIENIEAEQQILSDAMLNVFKAHGWTIEEEKSSDIHAKTTDGYTMTIDDGRCPDMVGALTHIYGQGGKIFEGRVDSVAETLSLMKILGFEKDKI